MPFNRFFFLFIDQFLKIWVKTNLFYGEYISIFDDWFYIHFIENNGMAYGLEFGGRVGKFLLTSFRVAFCIFFAYLIFFRAPKKRASLRARIGLSIIFAGALGNTIDCVYYGQLFEYEDWFQGRVVDMLYFPLINIHLPSWIPFVGGENFTFFEPVFNIADSLITCGIVLLLIYNKSVFNQLFPNKKTATEVTGEKIENTDINTSLLDLYADEVSGKFKIKIDAYLQLYNEIKEEEHFVHIILAGLGNEHTQRLSSWMVHKYLLDGGHFNQREKEKLFATFPSLKLWPAKLYILQSLSYIHFSSAEETMEAEDFVRSNLQDSNTFVRAWALNGLFVISTIRTELKTEVINLCECVLEEEKASVQVKAKHILNEIMKNA